TTKYVYSLAGSNTTVIHTIEDSRGYVTTYRYNSGATVASIAAGSAIWTFVYNSEIIGDVDTEMTTPTGAVVTYHVISKLLKSILYPEGTIVSFTYDNQLPQLVQFNAGNLFQLTWDHTLWQPTVYEDGLGNLSTLQYDGNSNLTTFIDAENHI